MWRIEQSAESGHNAYFRNRILNQFLDDYNNHRNDHGRDENETKFAKLGILFVAASLIMAYSLSSDGRQTATTSQRRAEVAETERL
jgi:hypothetical protein